MAQHHRAGEPGEVPPQVEGCGVFRLDGNLYGCWKGGSVYCNKLEEILVNKLDKNKFELVR